MAWDMRGDPSMRSVNKTKEKRISREGDPGREYLHFLSVIQREVERFNESFGFELEHIKDPVSAIDGSSSAVQDLGFVLLRQNLLMTGRAYCLYALFTGGTLYGYIGMYEDGRITTLKELRPLVSFQQGKMMLYEWMRQLVRASCDKTTL